MSDDHAIEPWNSTCGYVQKGPQPTHSRPRLDYRNMPPYIFGTPNKRKTLDIAAAAAEQMTIDFRTSTISESQGSADGTIIADEALTEKHILPHMRSPPKAHRPSFNKFDEVKMNTKNNDWQSYVPPHLRTPKPMSSTVQSHSNGSPIARNGLGVTSDHQSKATMLKDITNTPHTSKPSPAGTGNYTPAKITSPKHSPSTVSNATSTFSEASGATPVLNKGKGKVLELQAPIAGWKGPRPIGPPKWDNTVLTDIRNKRLRENMQDWLAQTVNEALDNPAQVNVEEVGFVTGEAPTDGQDTLNGVMDPELHKTYPTVDPYTLSKKGRTADAAMQDFCKEVEQKAVESKEDRKMLRRMWKEREAEILASMPPNPHKPKANIYVRPAEDRDLAQIAAIHNWFIKHSVAASEKNDLSIPQWRARWHDVNEQHYSFLVAVKLSGRFTDRIRRPYDETVVGFVYAEDFGDKENAYRLTCEMQFWVDHEYKRTGIGKTLVDRMLEALDPEYRPRHGTPFVGGEDKIDYMYGGRRIIRKVLIPIPYPADDDYDLKWQKKWLIGFDFFHVSTLPGIGNKLGRE